MDITEIVIISGKGGTGKTSITAALAILAKNTAVADCDVDAADLHLVLGPQVDQRESFISGNEAVIRSGDCTDCGYCLELCRFDAIQRNEKGELFVDPVGCEGCGVCVHFCPEGAIDFPERECGEWYRSDTRVGPMVHARLKPGGENSGKLVTTVRGEARRLAEDRGLNLVLVDGPPGIGCPVIASLTGASLVLAVTEPTLSGAHDLERVLSLTRHFKIPTAVCVNKWDLNPEMADTIESSASAAGVALAGRVRYDKAVTAAQVSAGAVTEAPGGATEDIRLLWNRLRTIGSEHGLHFADPAPAG